MPRLSQPGDHLAVINSVNVDAKWPAFAIDNGHLASYLRELPASNVVSNFCRMAWIDMVWRGLKRRRTNDMGSYNLPWEQEVDGSNPFAPIVQQLSDGEQVKRSCSETGEQNQVSPFSEMVTRFLLELVA